MNNSKKPKETFKEKIEKWKLYNIMTDLGEIARRYFVMNFFDGVLTVLGLIIGNFVLFLSGTVIESDLILIPALSVSVAIGISGISGGYLAERAERKAEINELRRSMAMGTELKIALGKKTGMELNKFKDEDYYPEVELNETECEEIEHVCVDPESVDRFKIQKCAEEEEKKEKTIAEKAQTFATNIASLINGLAPAVGGIIGLFPLMFVEIPTLGTYISCFVVMGVVLFLLGSYLAKISDDSIWKYGLAMLFAGILTTGISMLLGV